MPIRTFLQNDSTFGPEVVAILTAAFEDALQKLGSVGRDSPVALTLARTIIELAKEGERDTARLCDGALGRIAKQGK
jgi:hypothetical protein